MQHVSSVGFPFCFIWCPHEGPARAQFMDFASVVKVLTWVLGALGLALVICIVEVWVVWEMFSQEMLSHTDFFTVCKTHAGSTMGLYVVSICSNLFTVHVRLSRSCYPGPIDCWGWIFNFSRPELACEITLQPYSLRDLLLGSAWSQQDIFYRGLHILSAFFL